MRLVAGEDHIALAREVCGYDNKTTQNIVLKYKAVAKDVGNGQSNDNDRTMTRSQREWCVNSLSFLVPELSFPQLRHLGINIGESLYNSTKAFAKTGDPIYSTPATNYPGRKRLQRATDIEKVWIDSSQIVSRTNSQGDNLRVTQGGKAKVARTIASDFGCSRASAYRYCPSTVVGTRKHSDLCVYCETLRKVRMECVRTANVRGGDFSLPGDHPGQGMVREPGDKAAGFLEAFVGEDAEVAKLLEELKTLKWHEGLGETMLSEMKGAFGEKLVAIFDYSGNIELKGTRGDAKEFFRAPTLTLFGVMFVIPQSGGRFKREYVDIFSFDLSHTSHIAAASLQCAMDLASREKLYRQEDPAISYFSDKGKHFCSGEMAHGVLFEASDKFEDASYTYHACYHGKTPLDGHFSKIKHQLGEVPVEKWPNSKAEVAKLVLKSLKSLKGSHPIFLESKYLNRPRNKLIILDISCIQRLRRTRTGNPPVPKLTVEGSSCNIKTALLEKEPENTVNEPDLIQRESESTRQLCDKLKNQRRKLLRRQRH